jgi:hypothetical protein
MKHFIKSISKESLFKIKSLPTLPKILSIYFIASLYLFFLIYDTFIYLDPREVSWFGIDNTTGYIAQLYFIDDHWRFPLLRNPNYGGPLSTSLTFSGPTPLIGLIMKVFQINPELQFFGLWILLNIFLQLFFGRRFLIVLGVDSKLASLFAVFFITPFLVLKLQGHFWLISHYLLLWSLILFIQKLRDKSAKVLEICFLLTLSYLTNIYLLFMVLLVIGALFLLLLFTNFEMRRWSKSVAAALLSLVGTFILFDGFDFQSDAQSTLKMYLSSTYGYHGFNLLTFINPDTGFLAEGAPPGESNIIYSFSLFPYSLGMIPGAYEGFMYLGMGILLSLFIILICNNRINFSFQFLSKIQKVVLFILIFLLLSFSVSYRIGIGSYSIELPFPELLDWAFGIFRSSGRFMWPIAYFLIGWTILVVTKNLVRLQRVSLSKSQALFLATFFSLQILDTIVVPLSRQQNEIIITSNSNDYKTTNFTEKLDSLREFKEIRSFPQGNVLENHYAELNYFGWSLGITTDLHFTSRNNVRAMYEREDETFQQICSNNFQKFTLYAVSKPSLDKIKNCLALPLPIFEDEFHFYFGEK